MSDQEASGEPEPEWTQRARTKWPRSPAELAVDWIRTSGSLAGALVAVIGLGGYAMDKLPFAKAAEIVVVNRRIDMLSGSISSLQVNQLQSLELQLTDRVQQLAVQITRLKPEDSQLAAELRQAQNEASQRLGSVHAQLNVLQRGDFQ